MPCEAWPCALCTLGLQHWADMKDVENALSTVRTRFQMKEVSRFQLEMVEAAAMQAVLELKGETDAAAPFIRKFIMESFARPFNVFRSSGQSSLTGDDDHASDDQMPPPPPSRLPPPSPAGATAKRSAAPSSSSSHQEAPPPQPPLPTSTVDWSDNSKSD